MSDLTTKKETGLTQAVNQLNLNDLKRRIFNNKPINKRQGSKTPLQVNFMFDITGSTFKYFELIKEKIIGITDEVNHVSPNTQFAVFAFRNHGDEAMHGKIFYTTPLTSNIEEIHQAIEKIKKGGGGSDALTCMEDCLQEANKLPWEKESPKSMVIIGDMPPHGVMDDVSKCPQDINYRHEIEQLRKTGVKIYSVFCGYHEEAEKFYRQVAEQTGGRFLKISEIDLLVKILTGICMKETGKLTDYVERLKKNKQLGVKEERLLLSLK